jgi:hypothetical protein
VEQKTASRELRGRQQFAISGGADQKARDFAMTKPCKLPPHSAARLLIAAALLAAAAALAGCETTGSGVPVAVAAPAPEPMTHTQAAEICWMATEHGHADLPLDKRADIVEQCIKDKMAGVPQPKQLKQEEQARAKKP